MRAVLHGLTAVFMDEVDVNLNPKVGCLRMRRGLQSVGGDARDKRHGYLAGNIRWWIGRVFSTEQRPKKRWEAALFLRHLDYLPWAYLHYSKRTGHPKPGARG